MERPAVYPVRFSCAMMGGAGPTRHVSIVLTSETECTVDVQLGPGSGAQWSGDPAAIGEALLDLARLTHAAPSAPTHRR